MGLWSRLVSHKEMISVVRLTLAISALSTIARSERDGKSLLSTFPFNQAEEGHGEHHGDHHGGHHGVHHGDHRVAYSESLQSGDSRQGYGGDEDISGSTSFAAISTAEAGPGGQRCLNKMVLVEETVYAEEIRCDHSYDKRCHTSYVTNYESQQQEECEENFRKICFINYEQIAFNETVENCREPLVKDCSIEGPEICRTEYESECWTKQEVHDVEDDVVDCRTEYDEKCEDETSGYTTSTKCSKWPREVCSVSKKKVKKYTPITGCTKEPRELCAPAGCGFSQGPRECHEKIVTLVQDIPKETCDLEPQRTCKHVTKLVPRLQPKVECVDVPKEVCTKSKTNPQKKMKPVLKKWCYNPSQESGLA